MDLQALFSNHHQGLFRYLERMTGDPDAAADAVQEAFLKLAESPPADQSNLAPWLYTVATNHVRETMRTRRRRREILKESRHKVPLSVAPVDPAAAAERAEARSIVRRVLGELTERERTILLMREEGFKHREIAAAVGTTTKSVGTLITRALKKAAAVLEHQNS